ncbi:uracil phosphoribosyltransferase [Candidatus Cyanaurora vandensis]|uniref:uracil phosphoribosyltransferase n=1 Tax=Candidatus Cyanaurora vandensis TaxID=2714958 RepID=UPI00257C7781|nr:uracil phosphoribosyltransferase [Candidatus Cyanaurora vandensis]
MQLRVHVPAHPFIAQLLTICRDKNTPTPVFRAAVADLGRWLTYECCRDWLPVVETQVETPLGVLTEAKFVDHSQPIALVPVLRAGLALLEGCSPLLPTARIYHLGYRRDETTRQAQLYLNCLPPAFTPQTRILVLEPILATGGTLLQVLAQLAARGAMTEQIRIISVLASGPALHKLSQQHPKLVIYCAMIDEFLDDRCFIVPGLGDAGDRAFGTN